MIFVLIFFGGNGVAVLIRLRLVGLIRICGGRGFVFFRRAADDDGDRLPDLDDYTGARRLIENHVGLRVGAVSGGALSHIQTRVSERGFRRREVFADHVRYFYFGAAKREVNRPCQTRDERDGDADDDAEFAHHR